MFKVDAIFLVSKYFKGSKNNSSMLVYEIHLADNYSWLNMHSLLSEEKCFQLFWQHEDKYTLSTLNWACNDDH